MIIRNIDNDKSQILDFLSNEDITKLIAVLQFHLGKKKTSKLAAKSDIASLKYEKESNVPLTIFATEISPATALIKYLKEQRRLTYADISRLINRDQRTVWNLYSKEKIKKQYKEKKRQQDKGHAVLMIKEHAQINRYFLPISIFQNRDLSILENIVQHLISSHDLKPKQISSLLNKKIPTIYTIINRIRNKAQKTKFIKMKP